jgi:hypothetical protein
MPDHVRKLFDQANTERLLRQIEKRLTLSRGIISRIDMIRGALRLAVSIPHRTGVSVPGKTL